MTQEKISRINYLAKKSKTEGLSELEKLEQEALRSEYRAQVRANLLALLSSVDTTDIADKANS